MIDGNLTVTKRPPTNAKNEQQNEIFDSIR